MKMKIDTLEHEVVVKDAIGNSLLVGQKLFWKQADLYVTVKDVSIINGKIAALKLELDMGVEARLIAGKDGPKTDHIEAQFPMFIRVVDPASEAAVERAMSAR